MPRSNRVPEIEQERGESALTLFPRVIEEHNGNVFKAAVLLKLSPTALRYWLARHDLAVRDGKVVSLEPVAEKV